MYCDINPLPQIQLSESQSEVDKPTQDLIKEKTVTENAKVNYLMKLTLVIV